MPEPDDVFIERVSEELRAPVRMSEEVDARVMTAVRALPQHAARSQPRGHPLGWLVRTRAVRVSPLAALALAAGLAAVMFVGGKEIAARVTAPSAGPVADAAPTDDVRLAARPLVQPTRFTLDAPEARSVALIGQFNDWDAGTAPLARAADGRWELVLPLLAGRYEYAFVVDGTRIVADPRARESATSEFGAPNSMITVGAGTP